MELWEDEDLEEDKKAKDAYTKHEKVVLGSIYVMTGVWAVFLIASAIYIGVQVYRLLQ